MTKHSAMALALAAVSALPSAASAQTRTVGRNGIQHVLLLSVDGMHAVDLRNCAEGIAAINNGTPFCPNLAALAQIGVNYVAAQTSKPSDSFPGLTAIVSGGTPKSTGVWYDVAYDRSLDAPRPDHRQTASRKVPAPPTARRPAPPPSTRKASTLTRPS